MIIRPALRADIPAIVGIYNQAVLHSTATADYEPQTLDQRERWFDDRTAEGFPILVAELSEPGPIVGWGSLGPYHQRVGYRRTADNSVYVDEGHRGAGVGKALLGALIEEAGDIGVHAVVAVIAGDNEASVRLHASFGFANCGRLPELIWKFEHWIDVVYMVKLM